jgi:two-component system, cell cycle response regulator
MPQQILVIDDSLDIHLLLAARLRAEDVKLHQALTAEEGLRIAAELQPDLVLLDVDMPGTNGFEVCERLKGDPLTASLQIIFLTGTTEILSKVRGFDLGAVDYVTKPFDGEELRARVRAALRTKRFQDLLAVRAQIDGLTGVFNRAYLDRRLGEEVARCRRYGSPLTLVMADLDHFKQVNDRFGHPFGDRVLQAFADLLLSSVRATDAVCRYGGEEFVVLLPETSAQDALVVVRRVQTQLATFDLRPRGDLIQVTASWGLVDAAAIPSTSLSSEVLVDRADEALYSAKRSGRNCARVYGAPALLS